MSELGTIIHKAGNPIFPLLNLPTYTGSKDTTSLVGVLTRIVASTRPSTMNQSKELAYSSNAITLEEQLYNSRANCKLKIASVAMHLNQDWRTRFFMQLDNLLDINEWDEDDQPVTDDSFSTLLRLLLSIRPKRRPGLGATSNGHIIATWTSGKNRLTIECLPGDQIRWIVFSSIDDYKESAVGQTSLDRITDVLGPYQPEQWFDR